MIRLTDTTLMHIHISEALQTKDVLSFCRLLLRVGVEYVQMPTAMYSLLLSDQSFYDEVIKGLDSTAKEGRTLPAIVLHLELEEQKRAYPEIHNFVCRFCKNSDDAMITCEHQMNDIREVNRLQSESKRPCSRITGLDDILLRNYESVFAQLQTYLGKNYEFCPQNSYGLATATAIEWANVGGSRLVTAFGGIGNTAATEEVIMALRINFRFHPNHDYSKLPVMKVLFERLSGTSFPARKPVLGSAIFAVEAGIHADGISKAPYTYEPFIPESVGKARSLVVGKHSGSKAIEIKLHDLDIAIPEKAIPELLIKVQEASVLLGRSLSDEEFVQLVKKR